MRRAPHLEVSGRRRRICTSPSWPAPSPRRTARLATSRPARRQLQRSESYRITDLCGDLTIDCERAQKFMRCGFAVPPPDALAALRLDSAENVLHPLQNLAGLLRVERVDDGADRLHLRIERINARCRQAGMQLAQHFVFLAHIGLR